MDKEDLSAIFSHKSDEWSTPQWFFDVLNKQYHFTLDAASDGTNNKCAKFYTAKEDGLLQDWNGETVFVNPPYSKCYEWVKKAHNEAKNNGTSTVMLLPSRTDTKWFHEFCLDVSVVKSIHFIKGRLKFGDQKNSAPFPSMVVFFTSKDSNDDKIVFSTLNNRL